MKYITPRQFAQAYGVLLNNCRKDEMTLERLLLLSEIQMKSIEVFGSPHLLIIRDAGLNIQTEVTRYQVIQVSGWINCLCSGGTSEKSNRNTQTSTKTRPDTL
jgi:hypothetical protein